MAWCHFALQPKSLVEIVKMPEGRSLFADVREYEPTYNDFVPYPALVDHLEVIPVIRAHSNGGRWIWHASVLGLLSDGPGTPDYATKTEALMAGLEKYPTGIVDDRRRA
jgi:hypothetical protein